MSDSTERTLVEIRDSLARIEGIAERQVGYARLTMQSVFVLWIVVAIGFAITYAR